jgi:hypothetical protein
MRERISRPPRSNGFRDTGCVALMLCCLPMVMQMVRVYVRSYVMMLISSHNLAMNGLDDLRGMSCHVGDGLQCQVI